MKQCRLIIITDISEIIKSEYDRNIEKLSEVMIASVSHDMRTPLNTIINMNQLIMPRIKDQNILQWLRIS
jgi:signal transduction histidine kinase